MKQTLLLAASLSLTCSALSFAAAAPDLSKLSAQDVLSLGVSGTQELEGSCYHVAHKFCSNVRATGISPEVPADPKNCLEDDALEQRTSINLKQMKFVLSGRDGNTIIYKAQPANKKIKEQDLYTLRGNKGPSPIRYFVTLTEASCPVPAKTPDATPQKDVKLFPLHGQTVPRTKNPSQTQQGDVVAIKPGDNKGASDQALKFLTNIPVKPKAPAAG
ncbi:MAG: hypothetical protein C0514_04045 [Candidatus Puniceispirillum sp.]|nr:hypothetical protein [Candidatus Puniceispirillum sp.]